MKHVSAHILHPKRVSCCSCSFLGFSIYPDRLSQLARDVILHLWQQSPNLTRVFGMELFVTCHRRIQEVDCCPIVSRPHRRYLLQPHLPHSLSRLGASLHLYQCSSGYSWQHQACMSWTRDHYRGSHFSCPCCPFQLSSSKKK